MSAQKTVTLAFIPAEPKTESSSKLPPVILIHGMTDSKERWLPIIQKLANDSQRKVFAVDARNHGESERSEEFTFPLLAEDIEQFMISKGIEKATIYGHSMGGWVAMILALTKPERVEKIIVEDIPPVELPQELVTAVTGVLRKQQEFIKQFSPNEPEECVQEKFKDYIIQNVPPTLLTDQDRKCMKQRNFPIRKTDVGYEPQANFPVIIATMENPEKRKLDFSGVSHKEVLFLCGGKSFLKVYEAKDRILQLFPKARIEVFENAGHEILGVYPDEAYSQILTFLRN